jgi:heat shock protein HtpX
MGFAALLSQLIQGMSLFGQLLLIVNLPLILAGHHFLSMGGLLMLILAPYTGFLLQLALSRSREYLADMEAAALLGTAHPLAAALVKIERRNRLLQRRFLRWPLAAPPKDSLLRTHPPTRERVRRLMAMQAESRIPTALPNRSAALRPRYRPSHARARLHDCREYGYCH